jgi:5-methylthioadenosine/S-adenosylhomocysteine deaminase
MSQAQTILSNAIVLTMDDQMRVYEPGSVVIDQNQIIAVGPEEAILQSYGPAINRIDCAKKVLLPGLVNGHTHVPMTLLRALADDLRLDVWLMGYMLPVERQFVSSKFVRLGTQIACAEMIRGGTTCFGDMYYFEDDIAQAAADAGMRAVCSETIMKYPSPDAQSYEDSLAYTRDFIKKWKGHPLITPSIGPHAPYTCTGEILEAATALAVEYDVPLHIHISETEGEVENMRKEYGMPVIPYVKKHHLLEAKLIAAHCVHIDEGEMRTILHAGGSVVHNPSSNIKLASGFANVKLMIDLGLNVGIGTDGPASNNDLDMFEEMRLAAFLAKVVSNDPTALPAQTVLAMATSMGARALHIGDITGSIEKGKRADLILVDLNQLHNIPHFRRSENSIYAQIVYAAKASDVTDVMIDGNWVMQDRKLQTLDEQALIDQSNEYARQIDHFLILREKSVIAKLVAIGGATQEESFEVQAKIAIRETEPILKKLESEQIKIVYKRHYHEYDTYFIFNDLEQGYLRYREDHFVKDRGEISNVRCRLTHIGVSDQKQSGKVLLSRSRYLAPASQSLRFYREYFIPQQELEIEKDRLRFLINYKGTDFFINLDSITKPSLGNYLEVKSRTWSRKDAEMKSSLTLELIELLGAPLSQAISTDYFDMISKDNQF